MLLHYRVVPALSGATPAPEADAVLSGTSGEADSCAPAADAAVAAA